MTNIFLPLRAAHASKIALRHGTYSFSITGSNFRVGRRDHSQLNSAVSSSKCIVHVMPQDSFNTWRVVFIALC